MSFIFIEEQSRMLWLFLLKKTLEISTSSSVAYIDQILSINLIGSNTQTSWFHDQFTNVWEWEWTQGLRVV